jgi:hypothetical protein
VEVSSHLHAPTNLPAGKEPLVSIGGEDGLALVGLDVVARLCDSDDKNNESGGRKMTSVSAVFG